jgi:hypothetical protein
MDVKPARRFCIVSLSRRLALCFFKGLPITASSGKLELKTLLESVGGFASKSTGGGVSLWDSVPTELGDFFERLFKGSAEC